MINTILAYLQSKTIQGIILLIFLGTIKIYNLAPFDEATMNLLLMLALGWLGVGVRGAIKPIEPGK